MTGIRAAYEIACTCSDKKPILIEPVKIEENSDQVTDEADILRCKQS
jgi:hypothetical protein